MRILVIGGTGHIGSYPYLGFMDVKGKLRASFIVCLAAANSETFGEALKSMAGIINAFRSDIHLSCRLDRDTGSGKRAEAPRDDGRPPSAPGMRPASGA